MLGSSIVEAGCAFQYEPHLASDNPHQTDQEVPIGGDLGCIDRHEIDHFAHPVRRHETAIKTAVSGKYSCFVT